MTAVADGFYKGRRMGKLLFADDLFASEDRLLSSLLDGKRWTQLSPEDIEMIPSALGYLRLTPATMVYFVPAILTQILTEATAWTYYVYVLFVPMPLLAYPELQEKFVFGLSPEQREIFNGVLDFIDECLSDSQFMGQRIRNG